MLLKSEARFVSDQLVTDRAKSQAPGLIRVCSAVFSIRVCGEGSWVEVTSESSYNKVMHSAVSTSTVITERATDRMQVSIQIPGRELNGSPPPPLKKSTFGEIETVCMFEVVAMAKKKGFTMDKPAVRWLTVALLTAPSAS